MSMKRTKVIKKPNLILTSDWHLREDIPTCWVGDFEKEQWLAVDFIRKLQKQYKCPVVCAGDLFHYWKPSPELLAKTMYRLPENFWTIYGQHDLSQHNWDLRHKSGLYTLEAAGKVRVLTECHYGQNIQRGSIYYPDINKVILVWHHLTYITSPYPGAVGGMARGLLRKYPQFSLIVTGDNHCSFDVEYKGRLLVNPGNLTRQVADQIDFQPRVALWYAEDNHIDWINIPIQNNVISREHIERKENRDNRIDAFISKIDSDWKAAMSFEDNLETFKHKNKTKEAIMQIIYKSLE